MESQGRGAVVRAAGCDAEEETEERSPLFVARQPRHGRLIRPVVHEPLLPDPLPGDPKCTLPSVVSLEEKKSSQRRGAKLASFIFTVHVGARRTTGGHGYFCK